MYPAFKGSCRYKFRFVLCHFRRSKTLPNETGLNERNWFLQSVLRTKRVNLKQFSKGKRVSFIVYFCLHWDQFFFLGYTCIHNLHTYYQYFSGNEQEMCFLSAFQYWQTSIHMHGSTSKNKNNHALNKYCDIYIIRVKDLNFKINQ